MSDLSGLNPTPHAIAVYASSPLSPVATQHSLPSGRYSLLGPDFHRLDRTSLRLAVSLNHLVGAGEQRGRHVEPEHPRGRMVDHQFEFARLHYGQVGRLRALEDVAGVDSDLAIRIRHARSVADQPADFSMQAILIYCGNRVAYRQLGQLYTADGEERTVPDEEGVGSVAYKTCEGHLYLAAGAGVENLDLQPHGARSHFNVSQRRLGSCIGRVDEHGHTNGPGHELMQKLQPLCRQLNYEKIDSCQVAAWPRETGNKTQFDRVLAGDENDRDGRGCCLGRQYRVVAAHRGDHGDLSPHQFRRQPGQPIDLIVGPAILDRYVLTLDIACFLQALTERGHHRRVPVRRCAV